MKFGGQGYAQFMVNQTPVYDRKPKRKRKRRRRAK